MKKTSFHLTIILLLFLIGCKKNVKNFENTKLTIDTIKTLVDSTKSIAPDFILEIPLEDEKIYREQYENIRKTHTKLVPILFVDYTHFKNLIEKNPSEFVKFLYIQNSATDNMNIGLEFSDNNELYPIDKETYILNKEIFTPNNDVINQVKNFKKNIGHKVWANDTTKLTLAVIYKRDNIINYFKNTVGNRKPKMLEFRMIYFGKVKEDRNSKKEIYKYPIKADRISFSVHMDSLTAKKSDPGYDAGNLKP